MLTAEILVFTSMFVLSLVLSITLISVRQSSATKLKRRLRGVAGAEALPEAGSEVLLPEASPRLRLFNKLPLTKTITDKVGRSGLHVSPAVFAFATGMASLVCFMTLFALRRNIYLGIGASFAIVLGAFIFLQYRIKLQEAKFTEQLPEALSMISRSLRAGHSLTGAVELISEEMPEPSARLFKLAYEQQRFGMRMADSLATLPEKIRSLDLQFFVTIIRINTETGGNLAEILDKLADTIRARLQIRRQVRVYTAEGRLSAYILVVLPVVVFGLFYFMHPNYMNVFFTEKKCQLCLLAAGFAQIVGFLFIRKIVNIRI